MTRANLSDYSAEERAVALDYAAKIAAAESDEEAEGWIEDLRMSGDETLEILCLIAAIASGKCEICGEPNRVECSSCPHRLDVS